MVPMEVLACWPALNQGGAGRGFGIIIESSYKNTVRSNQCYLNGGTGGSAGAADARPGYSEGAGIFIQSLLDVTAEGNQVTDNMCYDNLALGVSSANGYASKGQAFGIALLQTTNSTIERNTVVNMPEEAGTEPCRMAVLGGGLAFTARKRPP